MNLIFVLAALQLPFTVAVQSAGPASQMAFPAADANAIARDAAMRQLLDATVSVMKRRTELPARNDSSIEQPIPHSVDQVVQASYQGTNGAAQPSNAQAGAATGTQSKPLANGQTGNKQAPAADDTASAPSDEVTTRAAANVAAELLASALAKRAKGELEGRPLSLAETLTRVNGAQRLEVASQYWKLALTIADYHWALDESQQLDTFPTHPNAVDSPLLAVSRARAQARVHEAKADFVAAQQELADAMSQPNSALPLTSDQPLVGPYRTEFEVIFANRAAPGRSRAIHRSLPHRRDAIDMRTTTVQSAAAATAAAEAAYQQDKSVIETVLFAHESLSRDRRAFLATVRVYNAEIVEYASYVAGPMTPTPTLVNMLTRRKQDRISLGSDTATSQGGNQPTMAPPEDFDVRQASGEQEVSNEEWSAAQKNEQP